MGGAWHGAGRELFLGLGPNNRNNGNNGVWLAVVVLVVSNRLLFKLGSLGLKGRRRERARRKEKSKNENALFDFLKNTPQADLSGFEGGTPECLGGL